MNFKAFSNSVRTLLQLPELNPEVADECINVGDIEACHYEEANGVIKEWVELIDQQLEKVEKFSEEYIRLIDQRLFTFDEYRQVFDASITADLFYQFPIFEFLMINTHAQRDLFVLDKQDTFEDYIQFISHHRHLEIADFLFRQLLIPLLTRQIGHVFIPGQTGSGKSELMKALFYQMQWQSNEKRQFSMVAFDPHGDLAEELREFDLNKNKKRVIYVDPFYKDGMRIGTNIFELKQKSAQNIDLYSQEIARTFQELIPNVTLSNQMEALLVPCISVLLIMEHSTLQDLQRFMDDEQNEDLISLGLDSPNENHRNFFKHHFKNKDYRTTKNSIYTKLQSLLNSQTFHHLMNGKSTFDLEKALNSGKVVIFNLSQGKMGTDCSVAYGRFLIAMIQGIALRRVNMKKKERKPIYIFIDEFQNYTSPSIEKILTETRKYQLHLILANQSLAQISDKRLAEVVMSNTNVKFVGANSIGTLKPLAQEIGVKVEALQQMKRFHFFLKVGDRIALNVNAPRFLVNNPTAFSLPKSESDVLKNYLIHQSGYYQPIRDITNKREPKEGQQIAEEDTNTGLKAKLPLRK